MCDAGTIFRPPVCTIVNIIGRINVNAQVYVCIFWIINIISTWILLADRVRRKVIKDMADTALRILTVTAETNRKMSY